jgi:hypothetical protein
MWKHLYKLLELKVPKVETCMSDHILKTCNHGPSLLSHNCEINPTELAWAKVKNYIDSKIWVRDGL